MFLTSLLALPACARNVVFRKKADSGVPRDAELHLWPVQSADVGYKDESIASVETHLIAMATRQGIPIRADNAPPLDAWSVVVRVSGLPIPPREPALIEDDTVDASAIVVIREGSTVRDIVEVNEEIRTYYSDYLPWRLARRITDVIALRRSAW